MKLEFIETQIFTKLITNLLSDTEYLQLQNELLNNPEKGDLIVGTGGVRKIRFGIEGAGKSGGIRIIYYYLLQDNQIYMLLAYPKSKKDTLTSEEKKQLKKIAMELKNG